MTLYTHAKPELKKEKNQHKTFLLKVKTIGAKNCMISLLNMCSQSHRGEKRSVFKTSVSLAKQHIMYALKEAFEE